MRGIPLSTGYPEGCRKSYSNFDLLDEARSRLQGMTTTADGMLGKKGAPFTFEIRTVAVRELEYAIKLVNKLDRPLTNVKFIGFRTLAGRLAP